MVDFIELKDKIEGNKIREIKNVLNSDIIFQNLEYVDIRLPPNMGEVYEDLKNNNDDIIINNNIKCEDNFFDYLDDLVNDGYEVYDYWYFEYYVPRVEKLEKEIEKEIENIIKDNKNIFMNDNGNYLNKIATNKKYVIRNINHLYKDEATSRIYLEIHKLKDENVYILLFLDGYCIISNEFFDAKQFNIKKEKLDVVATGRIYPRYKKLIDKHNINVGQLIMEAIDEKGLE